MLKQAMIPFYESMRSLIKQAMTKATDTVGKFKISTVVKAGACCRIRSFDSLVQSIFKELKVSYYLLLILDGSYN